MNFWVGFWLVILVLVAILLILEIRQGPNS